MTRALAALFLVLPLAAGSCIGGLFFKSGGKSRVAFVLTDPFDPRSPRDRFVRFQGQRDGGLAFEILPYFLFPDGPFEVTFDVGIFDPELVDESEDARGCFELFERDGFGDLSRTLDFCGRYVMGGYQAFNSENADQQFYAATLRVEARVAWDGANLTYETRPEGDPTYDLVTTIPYTPAQPFLPAFGAANLGKRGIVDFDDLAWTDTAPTDTDVLGGIGWNLQGSFQETFGALRDLDGATPDFASASTGLADARLQLGNAISLAGSLPDLKLGKQVIRLGERADRKLERAQAEVQDQDAEGAVKNTQKAVRLQGQAFQRLYGLDFRPQF